MKAAEARAAAKAIGLPAKRAAAAWAEVAAFKKWCRQKLTTVQGKPLRIEPYQELVLFFYFAGWAEILLLVPKGNGKTALLAALASFHLETVPFPDIYCGAGSKDQASKLYTDTSLFCRQLGGSKKSSEHYRPLSGYRAIYHPDGEEFGSLRVLASDKLDVGSLESIAPTLGLVDEYHAHRNGALYRAIHGALHKREGQMLSISTAGRNPETPLGELRAGAMALRNVATFGSLTMAWSKDFIMLEFACHPEADLSDMAIVKAANPASFVTKTKLTKIARSPSITESEFARYHANVWRESDHTWIPPGAWQECAAGTLEPPADEPIYLSVNMTPRISDKRAAIVTLWEVDGIPHCKAEIFEAAKGPVRHGVLREAILEAHHSHQVVAVAHDPNQMPATAVELDELGLSMHPVKMSPGVWVPLTADLMEAIATKQIRHDGDELFAAHVTAGELRDTPSGQMLSGASGARVEALMALGMAWHAWRQAEGESVYESRGLMSV